MLQADYVEVVEALKARTDLFEDRGRVCGWTLHAQDEALALAREVDAMVVVGGRDSSNTIQLVRVCEADLAESIAFLSTLPAAAARAVASA